MTLDLVTAFAPGRVNLIGEHTDYNAGLCLPFAIEWGITVTATPREDRMIEAHALELDEADRFEARAPPPVDGWRAYVRGAVAELGRAGHPVTGATLEIAADLQPGAGLASSAALEVAVCLALLRLGGCRGPGPLELARLCARVEHRWAGAETGLLDPITVLLARERHALRLDTATLTTETVPLQLDGWTLALLDSGVRHAHAASGYNERRAECRRACELLGVDSLRGCDLDDVSRLPPPLAGRARHVVSENVRVDAMVDALRSHDLERTGVLLDQAHASLRDDFEVSVPAVEGAVAELKRAGAAGARMVGGGFGGSVLGLFRPGDPPPRGSMVVRPGRGARCAARRRSRK